jgi:hypothetical protein
VGLSFDEANEMMFKDPAKFKYDAADPSPMWSLREWRLDAGTHNNNNNNNNAGSWYTRV